MNIVVKISILLLLVSCAGVPTVYISEYVKLKDLLYTLECELEEAIVDLSLKHTQLAPVIKNQSALATLKLTVVETGVANGDGSLVIPMETKTIGGTFGFTNKKT